MLVKLCLSDSKRTVPGWGQGRRQEGAQVWGRERWRQSEKEGGAFLLGTRMVRK